MQYSCNNVKPNVKPESPSRVLGGCGIGLRNPHMSDILQQRPKTPWFEIISDNFIAHNQQPLGGLDRHMLLAIREHYPISMHGVGMSLGSVDPLDWAYISAIKSLAQDLDCQWISEHASFASFNQQHYHDLLPLPYTEEALVHLSDRILQVQDYLQQPLRIENATQYIRCNYDTMSDGEFMSELVKRSGCHLLVDINNLYINERNHSDSAIKFIQCIPKDSVKEIHLAGFSESDGLLIDSHNAEIAEPVWKLYQQALALFGSVATLIEWDSDIPSFSILQNQATRAESYLAEYALESYANGSR